MDEEQKIRQLLNDMKEGWNAQHLETYMNGYWKSPELLFESNGEILTGWDTVHAIFKKKTELEELEFKNLSVTIRSDDENIADATGDWQITMKGTRASGTFRLLIKKIDIQGSEKVWKVVEDHTTSALVPTV